MPLNLNMYKIFLCWSKDLHGKMYLENHTDIHNKKKFNSKLRLVSCHNKGDLNKDDHNKDKGDYNKRFHIKENPNKDDHNEDFSFFHCSHSAGYFP